MIVSATTGEDESDAETLINMIHGLFYYCKLLISTSCCLFGVQVSSNWKVAKLLARCNGRYLDGICFSLNILTLLASLAMNTILLRK